MGRHLPITHQRHPNRLTSQFPVVSQKHVQPLAMKPGKQSNPRGDAGDSVDLFDLAEQPAPYYCDPDLPQNDPINVKETAEDICNSIEADVKRDDGSSRDQCLDGKDCDLPRAEDNTGFNKDNDVPSGSQGLPILEQHKPFLFVGPQILAGGTYICTSNDSPSSHSHGDVEVEKTEVEIFDSQGYLYVARESPDHPLGRGAFGTVYKGKWVSQAVGVRLPPIVIKYLNLPSNDVMNYRRNVDMAREVEVWKHLDHPNIVPFLGITVGEDMLWPAFVSKWMSGGTAVEYGNSHVRADRMKVLREAARGILYLHSYNPPITHGDIKPENIMIDEDGIARITDFGMSNMLSIDPMWQNASSDCHFGGTTAYMAPEMFDGQYKPTSQSDVYAFGITGWSIMANERPYKHLRPEQIVIEVATRDRRPPMLVSSKEEGEGLRSLWNILVSCWDKDDTQRPNTQKVLQMLYSIQYVED